MQGSVSIPPVENCPCYAKVLTMLPITAALTAEHKMFRDIFDQMERKLPGLRAATEVKELGQQLEDMLRRHAETEDDLLLMAQSADPEFKNRFAKCHRDHNEVSAEYMQLCATQPLTKAKALFKEGMKHTRKHIEYEERFIFPLIEKVVAPQILTRMGSIWVMNHPSFQSVTSAKYLAT